MPYFVIENFAGGVDLRRLSSASAGGTMREINNAFVNKGGEIEKRRKWAAISDVTAVLTASANRLKCVGPMETFDRDAVLFLVGTEGSGGSWTAEGGGTKIGDGRFEFCTYDLNNFNFNPLGNAITAHELYPDQILVSYLDDPAATGGTVRQVSLSFTTGDLAPSSDAIVTARTAGIVSTSRAVIDFVGRFVSAIGVSPTTQTLFKSDTGAPEADGGIGAGEFELRGQGVEIGRPFAIEHYYSQVAIFGERGIQFWNVDSDATQFSYARGISGEALAGQRATLPYADGDVLYLTANGIRSLQARDSSNLAVVSDVGSPIDEEIEGLINLSPVIGTLCQSIVYEQSGQAWFFIGSKVYVLSRYPSASVQAWSTFDAPTIDAALISATLQYGVGADMNEAVFDAARIGDTVCVRMGTDEVFVYGDTTKSNSQYDDSQVQLITPYFDLGKPATEKQWTAIDLTCSGTWTVEFSVDPNNEAWVEIATVTDISTRSGAIRFDARSTEIAFRLRSTSASQARLSELIFHWAGDGEAS